MNYNQLLKNIEQHYPGLNEQRLRQEFFDYTHLTTLDQTFSSRESKWQEFTALCLQGIPFAYIHGHAHFYGHEFLVTKDTLIPRFETELLCELSLKLINKKSMHSVNPLTVIDVGTGPGTIALTLLIEVHHKLVMYLSDLCPLALKQAQKNAAIKKHLFTHAHQLHWICADRMENHHHLPFFDLILSNPPYIPLNAHKVNPQVHTQVHEYEPHLALYLPQESYHQWMETFFKQVAKKLNPQGHFLMEGHEEELPKLLLMANTIFNAPCQLLKDYTDRFRFLIVGEL
jgi:release factor glutamine methyltransferase